MILNLLQVESPVRVEEPRLRRTDLSSAKSRARRSSSVAGGITSPDPTALFEMLDVWWALDRLSAKRWLSKVPRLDTSLGIVPWASPAVLTLLRDRRESLTSLRKSPYVLRTNPAAVGRAYASLPPQMPIVNAFDRKGTLVAYGTKADPWVFVALPRDLLGSPKRK